MNSSQEKQLIKKLKELLGDGTVDDNVLKNLINSNDEILIKQKNVKCVIKNIGEIVGFTVLLV